MKIDVAIKLIIVLLVIMIVSLSAALIMLNNDDGGEDEPKPTVTTKPTDTTAPDETPSQSTPPETTTPPAQTTPPAVTEKPTETTEPSTPAPDAPDGLLIEKSFRSETGVKLDIRADVTAYEKDGKVYLRVDVYLEHYSIGISSKNGVITIGDKEYSFKTGKVSFDENYKSETLIVSKEAEVSYGKTVNVKADIEAGITYGGQKIEHLIAEGTVTVE